MTGKILGFVFFPWLAGFFYLMFSDITEDPDIRKRRRRRNN
jgi:hypothetical protein